MSSTTTKCTCTMYVTFCFVCFQADSDDLMVCREQLSSNQLRRAGCVNAYRRSYAAALTSTSTSRPSSAIGGSSSKPSVKRKSEVDDPRLFEAIKRLYGEDDSAPQATRAGAPCAVELSGQGATIAHQLPVSVK